MFVGCNIRTCNSGAADYSCPGGKEKSLLINNCPHDCLAGSYKSYYIVGGKYDKKRIKLCLCGRYYGKD